MIDHHVMPDWIPYVLIAAWCATWLSRAFVGKTADLPESVFSSPFDKESYLP